MVKEEGETETSKVNEAKTKEAIVARAKTGKTQETSKPQIGTRSSARQRKANTTEGAGGNLAAESKINFL